jgi:hypothetical protein
MGKEQEAVIKSIKNINNSNYNFLLKMQMSFKVKSGKADH